MSEIQALDIISINVWQILISFANLLIIFLLLKKFLFKPVQAMFDKRARQVQEIYTDAEESRASAARMKAEYEQKMAAAREEADGIVRTAVQSARRESESIVAEASGKASHLMRKADADIAQARQQMLEEVRGEIGDLAVAIAEKVMEREISAKDHQQFVDDFIRNVGDDA